jgi:threonylcarbamoyladenosine tRNA methylthiotransferase MtaB
LVSGETDEHFLETYHFLNEMDISYYTIYVFERDNTEAAAK